MAKWSRGLAASLMISRSESDPITIDTRGLSAIKVSFPVSLFLRLQCTCADIFAVIHFFKADQPHGFISAVNRILQPWCSRCHSQHASAAGVENAIALAGSGMEDLHVAQAARAVQPGD